MRKEYRVYYSDELIDLVYQTWGAELSLFGYDFEGSYPDRAILPKVINSTLRDRVHYNWAIDELTIDGRVFPKNGKLLS